MIENPRGRLLTFREACAYLGYTEYRLRSLVKHQRIAHERSDGRLRTRKKPNGEGLQQYIKSGRIEFRQADLDAYLAARHVPAANAPTPSARPLKVRRNVDAWVDRLNRQLEQQQ